jgi:cell division transport system ATP-binding protein
MIILENVSKRFGTGVFGLTDVTFTIEKGEFAFLVGPTGSGKTTIFRMLIRETIPTQGSIVINNWDIVRLPGSKVPELRKRIGVVFQDLKLLPDRTVIENVSLPLELSGIKSKEARKRAEEILDQVGILEHANKFPVQLSGGERQRAAIARALVLSPEILLADEPTGDLDDSTAWEIVDLLKSINESGTTIIMATHNSEIVKKLNKRVIELNKGSLVNDKNDHKHEKKEHEEKEKKEEKHAEEKKEEKSEAKEEHKEKKEITDDFEEALKE